MNVKEIRKQLAAESKTYKPKCRAWTKEEIEIVRDFMNRVKLKSLAEKLGRTPEAIKCYYERHLR